MLPLINKKWRNVTILGFVFFLIIGVFEIAPLVSSSFEQVWNYIKLSNDKRDIQELKRQQVFNVNRKKHLTAVRKNLFAASVENSSGAGLMKNIDSIARTYSSRLVAVLPLSLTDAGKTGSVPNEEKRLIQVKIKAGYTSFYNIVRSLGKLPIFFSIKEIRYGKDDEGAKDNIAKVTIELLNRGVQGQ